MLDVQAASVCLRLSGYPAGGAGGNCTSQIRYIAVLPHFLTLAKVPYKTFGRMLKDYLVFSIQAGPTPARIVLLHAVRFVPWKWRIRVP